MATHDIFMPALSSTMTEGKIVEWLKEPGDKVSRGESVLVVESDKADMDVESFQDGYLAVALMPAGSMAPVGETIGLIVENEEEIASLQSQVATSKASVESAPPQDSSTPSGNTVIEDKALKASGTLQSASITSPAEIVPIHSKVINGRVVASPRAKKLASQMGVDLFSVVGTGPHGRIQAEDVKRATGQPINIPWIAESNGPAAINFQSSTSKKRKAVPSKTLPSDLVGKSFGSAGETALFNTLQNAVNKNMEMSLSSSCFRVGYTISTDKLDEFYKDLKPNGVTMTALLAKAVGETLARHPQVNAAYTSDGMAYPLEVNVAVAVAMEDGGLITPVLKNANQIDLFELSRIWADLVKRSRSKQLKPEEYTSGTFTLSNLGMFGVDRFDAILPPGTGAILAVGASRPSVIAGKDGSISVGRQMQVNLTADHRVIYGADGAAFLKDLADLIENRIESLAS